LRVVVRAIEDPAEVGMFAAVLKGERGVLAKEEEVAQRLFRVELVGEPLDAASGRCDEITDEGTSRLPGGDRHDFDCFKLVAFIAANGTA
jgi:hypothetical protein